MVLPHPWYRWEGDDLVIEVYLQPRASRDEISGPQENHLRVRVTAPPVEGKANRHLCAYLAKLCGVAKSQVVISSGETSRYKRVQISAPRTLPPHIDWVNKTRLR